MLTPGKNWDDTLFVITYDEYGGFFDHASPPRAVNPDGKTAKNGFGFDFLGTRIPTVLVSPRVAKGKVVPGKSGARTSDGTKNWEISSIVGTSIEGFGLDNKNRSGNGVYLTNRDRLSHTFTDLIFDKPRTDTLEKLPEPYGYDNQKKVELMENESKLELLEEQRDVLRFYCTGGIAAQGDGVGVDAEGSIKCGDSVKTRGDLMPWLKRKFESFVAKKQKEKQALKSKLVPKSDPSEQTQQEIIHI